MAWNMPDGANSDQYDRYMACDQPDDQREIQIHLETMYQAHLAETDPWGFHPHGCFYCGSNHPSDCCPDTQAKKQYWEGL